MVLACIAMFMAHGYMFQQNQTTDIFINIQLKCDNRHTQTDSE